jgi:hypothetical protein
MATNTEQIDLSDLTLLSEPPVETVDPSPEVLPPMRYPVHQ